VVGNYFLWQKEKKDGNAQVFALRQTASGNGVLLRVLPLEVPTGRHLLVLRQEARKREVRVLRNLPGAAKTLAQVY